MTNSNSPAALFADLCEQPLSKSWPPLLECVERFSLVRGLEAPLAAELRTWTDLSAPLATPQTPPGEVQRLRQEILVEMAATETEPSWFQVYLEPDRLNRSEERKQPLFDVELVLTSRTKGPQVLKMQIETNARRHSILAG